MDQIHEELKHTVSDDEQSDDGGEDMTDPHPVNVFVNYPERQPSMDSSSSQSEDGYDTCESRVSTEGNAGDHVSNSGDELGGITELTKLTTVSSGEQTIAADGGGDGPSEDVNTVACEQTEAQPTTSNQLKENSTDVLPQHARVDSMGMEYADAISDTEQVSKVKPMASVSPTRIAPTPEPLNQRLPHPPTNNYKPKQSEYLFGTLFLYLASYYRTGV